MSHFRISILVEDQAKMGFLDKKFGARHGFSIFIEGATNVLFDAGPTDTVIENAALLNIDLQKIDCITLSHGHWDHTDGLASLELQGPKRKLVAHPNIFADRHKATGEYNGIALGQAELTKRFDLLLTREPYRVSENIMFLGEIPRLNDFEAKKTSFFQMVKGQKQDDFIMDDTALAIQTESGLVVVTGCSHAGICNIVEHSKRVCNENKVHMVLGGFHLLGNENQLQKTIDYFLKNPVDHLYPMHCTDLPSLCAFYRHFRINKLCSGDILLVP